MATNPQLRVLCYWYVLFVGAAQLCGALFLGVTVTRVTLGILYVASAAYMLMRTKRSPGTVLAIQSVE